MSDILEIKDLYARVEEKEILKDWSSSPFTWGEKHGWKKEER